MHLVHTQRITFFSYSLLLIFFSCLSTEEKSIQTNNTFRHKPDRLTEPTKKKAKKQKNKNLYDLPLCKRISPKMLVSRFNKSLRERNQDSERLDHSNYSTQNRPRFTMGNPWECCYISMHFSIASLIYIYAGEKQSKVDKIIRQTNFFSIFFFLIANHLPQPPNAPHSILTSPHELVKTFSSLPDSQIESRSTFASVK